MEYIGWICPNCKRAIASSSNNFSNKTRISCRICRKSFNYNNIKRTKPSLDPNEITQWVIKVNSV